MKRILHLTFIVLLAMELAGCMTRALLSDKQYDEKIQARKVTEDVPRLVIVGEKQTYVFDLPEPLKKILQSSYRSRLNLNISKLSLDASGAATAQYMVRLDKQASLQEQEAASADGLRKTSPLALYALEGHLVGKRYKGAPELDGESLNDVQTSGTLRVQEAPGVIESIGRITLVPVTVTVDLVGFSLVFLGAVIVTVPIMIYCGPSLRGC
ncbi:hypothetical protein P3G55_24900 [Leptospira sp. 96542]|nr:hypothetical protein [Leptospira sp. 96542]